MTFFVVRHSETATLRTRRKSCRAYRPPQRPPTKHVPRFSVASSVVVAIVFGIVVDDTIHFLSNYLEGCRKGLAPADAVLHGLQDSRGCAGDDIGGSRGRVSRVHNVGIRGELERWDCW